MIAGARWTRSIWETGHENPRMWGIHLCTPTKNARGKGDLRDAEVVYKESNGRGRFLAAVGVSGGLASVHGRREVLSV